MLWALPRSRPDRPDLAVPQVVHAPTPTDEPMAWPALLIATFPLEPSRRHVAPGALTDRIVSEAATTYAELLVERAADGDDVLPLVPVGLGAGALDAALRLATLERLRDVPILRAIEDGSMVRPRDAVVIDGAAGSSPDLLTALAPFVAGLVDAPPSGRTALRQLGTASIGLSEVIEALPLAPDPEAWVERYAALNPLGDQPEGREALGVLPVPLADGRVVRGARGLLLPPEGMPDDLLESLAAAGVRLVHPVAAHPLLARLGALPATARQVLDDPAVRELVETSPDADDPDAVAFTVLGLVRSAVEAGQLEPGDLPWLGDLALPDDDDELAPAASLALPGSLAAEVLEPDEIGVAAATLVEDFGAATLTATGVLDGLAVLSADDVDLLDPGEELAELDGFLDWATWAAESSGADLGPTAGTVVAVRDLDVVRPDCWASVVGALAASPITRAGLVQPVRVHDRRGRSGDVAPYAAWWLRRELGLAARADAAAEPELVALLDPAPEWVSDLDEEARRALGVVRTVDDLSGEALAVVLDRMADPDRSVDLPGLLRLWAWLATQPDIGDALVGRVRAVTADAAAVLVVERDQVCVIDQPMWLQRKDIGAFVIAPPTQGRALADLLDLDEPEDRVAGLVTSAGRPAEMPDDVRELLPTAPAEWFRHERLEVDEVQVEWWVDADGLPHANDPVGLALAVAWAAGRWSSRFVVAALLADPARRPELVVDAAFD